VVFPGDWWTGRLPADRYLSVVLPHARAWYDLRYAGSQERCAVEAVVVMTEETSTSCQWCAKPFQARRGGGSPRRFCCTKCRTAFWSALRRWGEHAIAAGVLTVVDIRNGDPAACTLPGVAISPPPVSQGGIQPGEVLDAAEIVEDKPSAAQPGPEPMQPFEVDPASLWGPRLSLYRDRRMWLPKWGPRPDQDGCQAPDYLL